MHFTTWWWRFATSAPAKPITYISNALLPSALHPTVREHTHTHINFRNAKSFVFFFIRCDARFDSCEHIFMLATAMMEQCARNSFFFFLHAHFAFQVLAALLLARW